ncbi:MAG TPA: hypothetical protein PLA44_13790 [Propionibacteriaceae bacterium]|nr:hypothetical protein [Propionibacteriaceae bacterium]
MAKKNDSTRARARREVALVRDRRRAALREKDERIERAAVEFALGTEQCRKGQARAGRAVEALFAEGLSASDVSEWCGGVSLADLRRLRQLAKDDAEEGEDQEAASPAAAVAERAIDASEVVGTAAEQRTAS